ncbi:cytochrome P450 [Rhizopogon vinicolor AM-OR11-026]|uniref:Cytochrome P450 n=1 Tax=Rhizopogon vinicolor AM-OR11-026 TaxID=1314800 RepID=A0A1B7MM74_9AGAM|nr:cytochrome P450 [Rhizopogon vinicolor AM-OR11-026]
MSEAPTIAMPIPSLSDTPFTPGTITTTQLGGPPSTSIIYGVSKDLIASTNSGVMYERWPEEYGVVYKVVTVLGCTREGLVGRGLLWAQSESHRKFLSKQRKSLTPTFSNAAIRKLISVFYTRLDTIGIAGFSHDFGSLDGKHSVVTEVFDNSGSNPKACYGDSLQADGLQMKVLLLAVSLTWALIELSQHPNVQTRLREELLVFGSDPTYDQLKANLPFLDAVVHEVLRLHPPITEFNSVVTVAINCSTVIWGPDAKQFKPDRWLTEEGTSWKLKEVQGHRHLLTFINGPKTCLGKDFANAEFKTVLSVLVKNFVFELRDGPETGVEIVRGIFPRPQIAGEDGIGVPLRIRRHE